MDTCLSQEGESDLAQTGEALFNNKEEGDF